MAAFQVQSDPEAGSARLPVVVFVSLINMFFAAVLEYSLPLYFNALESFPDGTWARLAAWLVAPWAFVPFLAGLLARRFGERRVWGAAMLGQAVVPALFAAIPEPWIVAPAAFWYGSMNALIWIGGISLTQIVPANKKGLANGLVMMSLGLGSFLGPLVGRAILWHDQVAALVHEGAWIDVGRFLIDIIKPESNPSRAGFQIILWGVAAACALGAVVMWTWGQRPGRWQGEKAQQTWAETADDLRRLLTNPRFWALVLSLCLFGGSIFQASNQFLPSRAEDLGLIVKKTGEDRGWILLQELRVFIWVPGGLAVGLLAGRRAPGLAGVLMVGCFALAAVGIGLASTATSLFFAVAAFEFVRQFMRWSHAGYLSEHMPQDLRATAIGLAISVAGWAGTLFAFLTNGILNPKSADFNSRIPFWLAAGLGLTGALGLLVFDRFVPIRQRQPS
jgi:MFS family permease